jgi:hypothetical protein
MTREKVYLNKSAILAVNDMKSEEIFIDEWDSWVIVRALTGKQRDEYESSLYKMNGNNVKINLENVRALLVALSCVDKDGNRLFSKQDIEALGDKSASALDKIATVASKLSGLTASDKDNLAKPNPFVNS